MKMQAITQMLTASKRAIVQSLRAFVALLAGVWVIAPAHSAPSLTAYGQFPTVDHIAISADGSKFAAIVGDANKAEIQIRSIADNSLLMSASTEKGKLRDLAWVGSNHLVATTSVTAVVPGLTADRREWYGVQDYNLTKKQWTPVLERLKRSLNVLSGEPIGLILDGKPVIIVRGLLFPNGRSVSTLFKLGLDDETVETVEVGKTETVDWVVDSSGKPVARADYNQTSGDWRLFVKSGGEWQAIYTEKALIDRPDLLSLGRTADKILVATQRSGDLAVHEVALGDGSWSPPLIEYQDGEVLRDPVTRTAIGAVDQRFEGPNYRFFDEADARLWRGIGQSFNGEKVSLAAWSDDRNVAIVEVVGSTNGDGFFLVDRRAKTAKWLADRYKSLAPDDLGRVLTIRYKAADGLVIPAYVTLPPRVETAKGLPLVVLPHGGPAAHDSSAVDWWAQAIASRGYVVLQPQFRGSTGLGIAHKEAGYGEWGRKMQTDLSDGVRYLAVEGMVDPKRVCIVGGSYGGYAALAGATIDTGVYRCAAAIAGVSDPRRLLEEAGSSDRRNSTMRYLKRFLGAKNEVDPRLAEITPVRLAKQATIPVLLVHGKDDTVVPYEQSTIMETALKKAGAKVELVTLTDEDHWLSRPQTRIAMLQAVIGFLEMHNPSDNGADGSRSR